MPEERIVNIPNLLSFYRVLAFPFVLYFAITGHEKLFVILLMTNLATDILDGLIARVFHMQTEFGARLDSVADIGTYILAIIGIFVFKASEFQPHLVSFGIFIMLFTAANLLSILKFKRLPSLHLYSWKIGGYIQGFFFFVLFVFDFYPVLYFIMICWGILAFCEHICIQLIISGMQSNQKGLFWVLKGRKII
jgi:cardiolipin synthase (CMP-forming)